MAAGFDPVLDGTAAPFYEMGVRTFDDGTFEVTFPDEQTALYANMPAALAGCLEWTKRKLEQ